MKLFVWIIVLYLGILRQEVKGITGLVIVLLTLKGKLNGKYFKNSLEKIIIGMEKIIAYYMYSNWCGWMFHAK